MVTLPPELQEVVDRQRIYDVLTRYCRALEDVFGPTYLQKFGFDASSVPHDFVFGGRYVDRLEKRGGAWRIAKRTVVMDWNINQPTTSLWSEGMFAVLKTYGARDRSDTAYERLPT